jgi:hypothetical protein
MSDEELQAGDVAVHGHEVYPADVPSLGYPHGAVALSSAAVPEATA